MEKKIERKIAYWGPEYPVSLELPDGSTIEVNDKKESNRVFEKMV